MSESLKRRRINHHQFIVLYVQQCARSCVHSFFCLFFTLTGEEEIKTAIVGFGSVHTHLFFFFYVITWSCEITAWCNVLTFCWDEDKIRCVGIIQSVRVRDRCVLVPRNCFKRPCAGWSSRCCGVLWCAVLWCAVLRRGRLNVLANVLRKPMPQIFKEFQVIVEGGRVVVGGGGR